MAESNVSGPWNVEGAITSSAITASGAITAGGAVTAGGVVTAVGGACYFVQSTYTSTEFVALTSTITGRVDANVLIVSSTGGLCFLSTAATAAVYVTVATS